MALPIDNKHVNCPNCGAPVGGKECAYCGTAFEEPRLEMAIGKVVKCSFEHDGRLMEFDLVLGRLDIDNKPTFESCYDWSGNCAFTMIATHDVDVTFGGRVVPQTVDGRECLVVERRMDG